MEWRNHVAVPRHRRATAGLLAQRGAAVCVNYAMHADAAEALVAECGLRPGARALVACGKAEIEDHLEQTGTPVPPYLAALVKELEAQ
jgi:hypothetical protein